MIRVGVPIAVCIAALSLSAAAQELGRPDIQRAELAGRSIFERNCAPCHGTGAGDDGSRNLPGTAKLEERYEGVLPGELELRGDLNAATLRLFVRRGIGPMPAFRPSEISDAEIAAIAEYIAATARMNSHVED